MLEMFSFFLCVIQSSMYSATVLLLVSLNALVDGRPPAF
jgi:hypothetical protein